MSWGPLLALAAGWALGKAVKKEEVLVSPTLVFIPPKPDELKAEPVDFESFDFESLVRENAPKHVGRKLNEEEIDRIVEELKLSIPNRELFAKIHLKYRYLDTLQKIQEAFCEGRIDGKIYVLLRNKYMEKLVRLEVLGE